MRQSFLILAALAVVGLVSTSAAARTFPINFVSYNSLAASCKKAGGTSYTQTGTYGCAKGCGSGTCSVDCTNDGQCTGTTPDRTKPGNSAQHVLGLGVAKDSAPAKSGDPFGDGILGSGSSMNTGGPAATGTPAGAPKAPAAAPVILR